MRKKIRIYFPHSRRDDQPDGHRLAEVHGHGPADQHHLVEPAPDSARHVLPVGHLGRLVIGRYVTSCS